MAWHSFITRKLYVRIWFTVVAGVLLLSLVVGWVWHSAEQERSRHAVVQDVIVSDPAGHVIHTEKTGVQCTPNGGVMFTMDTESEHHRPVIVQVVPLDHGLSLKDGWWDWLRPPYGFWWALGLAGITVIACMFPIVRRLTRRLELLQSGIERWEQGDLTERLPESGNDEIARLIRPFNTATDHITALIQAHKLLLANASHELRSPLARIRMAVELASQPDNPNRQIAREEILRNVGELDQMVGEVLLASRVEAKGVGLETVEPVDLLGLLAEECSRVGTTLDIAPEIVINPGSACVQGVPWMLRHGVRNLLENAARHGKQAERDSQISVQIAHAADANAGATTPPDVLIHVDDCGPGVPPESRERIFEPFYRVPSSSENTGIGLGLPLVRSIALRHGGNVTCGDHEGGGARFTLRLPVTGPHPA
ncbi:MAG: HAMP domain-containing histidine kinase [Burkholderiaceae bacterium]|nr:HAMP domain-containing histidine kinase [Burkholderiaceae bacterium]